MGKATQFIVGIIGAMGAFCLGAVIGWSGPVETEIKYFGPTNFPRTQRNGVWWDP